jgi:hypothetical protein
MLTTMAKQESKIAAEAERPKQPVLQAPGSIYPIKADSLSVPIQAPLRQRHFIQIRQYYTGDA